MLTWLHPCYPRNPWSITSWLWLCRIDRPNGSNRLLRIKAGWTCLAARVGPIPARLVGSSRRHDSAAGHLEMAIGVGVFDPFPCVAQPVVAFRFGQQREPGDFVPTPDERRLARLAWIASAKIIELHEERQVLARPSAGRGATFAPGEYGVGVANLQDSFVSLVGHFDDAQREGMKIEQQFAAFHVTSGRR